MQKLLNVIYPAHCFGCHATIAEQGGLCGACWADVSFIGGPVCDCCGSPLPGDMDRIGRLRCDDCMEVERPWDRGRAALRYTGKGRDLVLKLKHGDRTEIARPAGRWMAGAAEPVLVPGMLVVPVPVHWLRLLRRRYNQAALLARAVAAETQLRFAPGLLLRKRATAIHNGMSVDARFRNLEGAITTTQQGVSALQGAHVLLVDDVMTSGATFSAAAEVCRAAGASSISVLALARATKDA